MNAIFAERFKAARLLKGFSLQDLANELETKISRQALHKYETGEVLPDAEMISVLCKALNVTPDFFFNKTEVQIDTVEFRKANSLPVKESNRIIEIVKDKVSKYLEIEEILALKTTFSNPLDGFPEIQNNNDIERAAEEVRKHWNLGESSIASCIELLEDKNIKIIIVEAEDGFDGMKALVNKTYPVIAINTVRLKSADRVRFTILHELAHLILPISSHTEQQKERFCNQFAGALLISKTAALNELGPKRSRLMVEELGEIKKEYGISIQALVMRAKNLEIISNLYCTKFLDFFKQVSDWKINEPSQYKFEGKEFSKRFNQLIFRALAENLISKNKAAALNNQTVSEFMEKSLLIG